MTDKQKKITAIITVTGTLLLLAGIIALIWNIVTLIGLAQRSAELEERQRELTELSQSHEDEIEYRSSADYIEKYARDYLNMKYENEEVYS